MRSPGVADYADLSDKAFFPGLIKYMASGPVVAMVWQGLDAVKTGRSMLGATNPLASAPGERSHNSHAPCSMLKPIQAPFVATLLSPSAVTSATALTRLRTQRRRSLCAYFLLLRV
jgi:hypothetical protein